MKIFSTFLLLFVLAVLSPATFSQESMKVVPFAEAKQQSILFLKVTDQFMEEWKACSRQYQEVSQLYARNHQAKVGLRLVSLRKCHSSVASLVENLRQTGESAYFLIHSRDLVISSGWSEKEFAEFEGQTRKMLEKYLELQKFASKYPSTDEVEAFLQKAEASQPTPGPVPSTGRALFLKD